MSSPKIIDATQEKIISEVCTHFQITEQDLIDGVGFQMAGIRHICFYLVSINTALDPGTIAMRLGKRRHAARYGIEKIETSKRIYGHSLANLKLIAKNAGVLYE